MGELYFFSRESYSCWRNNRIDHAICSSVSVIVGCCYAIDGRGRVIDAMDRFRYLLLSTIVYLA